MQEELILVEEASTKQQLMKSLSSVGGGYENYLQSLGEKKLERIRNHTARRRHGLHAVAPMVCMGPEKCLFIEHCPIPPTTEFGAPVYQEGSNGERVQDYGDLDDYPMGRPCVMEALYMQQKTIDYVEHLEVDPANPIEMSIVNELALLDLIKNRCLMIMGKGDSMGQGRDFLKIDMGEGGDHTTLHPVADYMDRIERRREKWHDKLLETRKAKLDMATKLGKTDKENHVLLELQRVREALQGMSMKSIEDAEEVLHLEFE